MFNTESLIQHIYRTYKYKYNKEIEPKHSRTCSIVLIKHTAVCVRYQSVVHINKKFNHCVNQNKGDYMAKTGNCNKPEFFPLVCAFDFGNLVKRSRNTLKPCNKQNRLNTALPDNINTVGKQEYKNRTYLSRYIKTLYYSVIINYSRSCSSG